jgi:hypothetical protein
MVGVGGLWIYGMLLSVVGVLCVVGGKRQNARGLFVNNERWNLNN